MIAHRLNTLAVCDLRIQIANGRLVEITQGRLAAATA
jgi:ABC-type transport system involved in Fe-S cluster assembly fused permease/ATPase subunit